MSKGYVTFNAGSSSLKFSIFVENQAGLALRSHGEIERMSSNPHLLVKDGGGGVLHEQDFGESARYEDVLKTLIAWIDAHLESTELCAIGHRVVHGGRRFDKPVVVTRNVIEELASLSPLAPLHQPHNLLPIRTISRLHPTMKQVACFDTAFHVTNPPISRLYALPRRLTEAGLVRYGFHGLSYEYIARQLPRYGLAVDAKVIVAHLGSGASMCAITSGRSVATTMGFSALDGLPMGTRCGNIDPGILLYLMREHHLDAEAIEQMLYRESGLLGVSNLSADMRDLLTSEDASAHEAIELFIYRIGREIGSLAAAMQGLDAIVFTAGIGEHASAVRAKACAMAAWLGVALDEAANEAGARCISRPESKVSVWVIPTDEEFMIACHTRDAAF
ncbi:MAG TPA: acetate/propionate family kinase [Noviherbaspirillum sp.]